VFIPDVQTDKDGKPTENGKLKGANPACDCGSRSIIPLGRFILPIKSASKVWKDAGVADQLFETLNNPTGGPKKEEK
jgi:hypothetical protein